ncbi:hypothetical protein ACR6C2_38585 [Streptomyces sp. INA 01156]
MSLVTSDVPDKSRVRAVPASIPSPGTTSPAHEPPRGPQEEDAPMTAEHRILMVMPYRQLVEKAVAAGFRVWSIWDRNCSPGLSPRRGGPLGRAAALRLRRRGRAAPVVRETALAHDVAHVLHLGRETTMLPVAEEAHALGLAPRPRPCAASTTRRRCANCSPGTASPPFAASPSTAPHKPPRRSRSSATRPW